MTVKNRKQIEESATLAVKSALLRCPTLSAYINENDKTPSWDGQVFVYGSAEQKKEDGILVVPIQVKGTTTKHTGKMTTFPCDVSDLKNYCRNQGCIFFFVSVDLSTQIHKIYFTALQVYDLKKLIDSAGKQKSKTVQLQEFPEDDPKEITNIFVSFAQNSVRQASFADKEIKSLDELIQDGVKVESLSFSIPGMGNTPYNIGEYVSSHDVYLYAKVEGLDIEIPVDKVHNMTMSRPAVQPVCVAGKQYYDRYFVVSKDGATSIAFGKGITAKLFKQEKRLTLHFKPTGVLSDFIRDASFMLDIFKHRQIEIGAAEIPINEPDNIDVDQYKNSLAYYKDVKKMLDILGVTEELQCASLTKQDENNLRNFVFAVLYHREIGFPQLKGKNVVASGGFKIANLSIWIWAEQQESGKYMISNYFSPHPLVAFAFDDINKEKPVPASHLFMMDKDAFLNASNLNYQFIERDLLATKLNRVLIDQAVRLLLEILKAYDEQSNKSPELLLLAEKVCSWIEQSGVSDTPQNMLLNRMQIVKRQRKFKVPEMLEVGKQTEEECPSEVRCGAFLLLDDVESAQKCFNELPLDRQKEFLTYPICHFGKLEVQDNAQQT